MGGGSGCEFPGLPIWTSDPFQLRWYVGQPQLAVAGLPPASGSGTYDYVPYGGGSPDDPDLGDWRDLRLTLTLRPAGPMFFAMPQVGITGAARCGIRRPAIADPMGTAFSS